MMGKKNGIVFCTALLIAAFDQLSKFLIRQNLGHGQSTPLLKNVLHLTYVTNTGSAFGLLKGLNSFFILFSIIVIFAVLHYIKKIKQSQKLMQFAIGLLLGGTIGNLIDRIFYGAVADFIDFRIWPVFNIADSAVTISITLLVVMLWKND